MAGSQDFAALGIEIKQEGAQKTKTELERLVIAAEKTARSMRAVRKSVHDISKAQEAGTRQTKRAKRAQDGWNDTLTRSSGRLKVIGRDINRYFIVPMTAFVGLASRAAFTLNDGLGNVQALIPDTGDRIYELQDAVRDLGAETGKTFQDITDGLYRTISVFQDNSETVERLNTAIKAGIAGYATTAEAVQLLSSVTRSYGDTSAAAVDKVADLAFETIRLGDTTMPQLSAAMQIATDRAVRLGISQEELFAVMSTLTGITGDASMVATQFRSAMDSILRPTDELTQLIQQMGYETAEAAIAEESMIGLLVRIGEEAKRTGQPLQNYITRKEGVTLVSRLASEQLGDFAMRLGEIESSTGAANEAFENVTEGVGKWNFEIRKGRERINGLLSEIGDNLLPILARLLQGVGDVVEAFARMPDPVQRATIGMIGFATALSTVLQIWGAFRGLKIVALMGGIGRAVASLSASASVLVKLIAGITGVGAAIAATAALIGITSVRAHRRAEEAAQNNKETLEGVRDLQKEITSGAADMDRAFKASILSRQQAMREQGGVRNFEWIDGEVVETGLLGRYFLTEILDDERVGVIKERFESQLEYLKGEVGETLNQQREELANIVNPGLEEFHEMLDEMAGDYGGGIEGFFGDLFSGARVDPKLYGRNMALHIEELREALVDSAARLREGPFSNDPGIIEKAKTMTSIAEWIGAYVGSKDELNDVLNRIRQNNENVAGLEASINELDDIMNGEGGIDTEGITGPSWQEIFEKVTGMTIAERSGTVRYQYETYLDDIHQANVEFIEGMGGEVDYLDLNLKMLQKQADDLQGLLLDHSGTFSVEGWTLFSGGDNDLINQFQDRLSEALDMSSEKMQDLEKDMQNLEKNIDFLTSGFLRNYDVTDDLTGKLEEYQTLLGQLESFQSLLAEANIVNPELDGQIDVIKGAIETLTELLEKLGIKIEETGEAGEDAGKKLELTFSNVMGSVVGLSDTLKDSLFNAFMGIDSEMEEMSDESKKRIAIMTDMFVEMGAALVSGIGQSINALGQAIGEFGKLGEGFADIMANLWLSILETIPALMIQAGLMLLSSGNVGLGLGLLAMGLAGNFVSGYVQGRINQSNTEAQKDLSGTQNNAKGAVINTPVSFSQDGQRNVAGEAGWESIMPLTRNADGELGVKAQGGSTELNVNVHNYGNDEVEVRESQDGSGNIDVIIKRAVKGVISSGGVDKEMRSRYGVRTARA